MRCEFFHQYSIFLLQSHYRKNSVTEHCNYLIIKPVFLSAATQPERNFRPGSSQQNNWSNIPPDWYFYQYHQAWNMPKKMILKIEIEFLFYSKPQMLANKHWVQTVVVSQHQEHDSTAGKWSGKWLNKYIRLLRDVVTMILVTLFCETSTWLLTTR